MKTDYYIYQTKRIMKMVLCAPILIILLLLGVFIEVLRFIGKSLEKIAKAMDRVSTPWIEKGSWINRMADWINKS